jgi:hypothetical protein
LPVQVVVATLAENLFAASGFKCQIVAGQGLNVLPLGVAGVCVGSIR